LSEPIDLSGRRPLASRDLQISQKVAHWLAERRVRPNAISIAGLVAGVLAGVSLALTAQFPAWAGLFWIAGAALIQLRLLANLFDGMVAVETGEKSPVGELFNEVPDRVSDPATLIGLGYAAHSNPMLGLAAACVALFVAYVRAIGRVAGAPQEFCGPMAKQQRMFVATMTALWCGLTPTSWHFIANMGIPTLALIIVIVGGVVTAIRRLLRIGKNLRELRA
jgi:phosphatidylglycerophosphate synthase